VKAFFSWLAGRGAIAYDPAASLVLPKTEHRLPEATLSAEEVEAVLAVPDVSTPLGVRDRAMLEVLYSSAIRRAELAGLRVPDVDVARGTLFVRRGKGGRDRHVPVGERARAWVLAYRDQVRPTLVGQVDPGHLFLSAQGRPLDLDVLSRSVAGYVRAGAPERRGACHLFRHSVATLMLDNGADVRYVGELLGHQKLETTMLYTRVSLKKLREVHAATHPAEAGPIPRTA
jgi:integrase/recombinase XerD